MGGHLYFKQDDFVSALKHYGQSLNIEDDRDAASKTLFSMGVACAKAKRLNNAINFFERSLELRKGKDNQKEVTQTFSNLAKIYSDLGKFDVSFHYYRKASAHPLKKS